MALPAVTFLFDTIRDDFDVFGGGFSDRSSMDDSRAHLIQSEADAALLTRLRHNDERALHEIFDTYLSALIRFADVTLGTTNGAAGDAGDIVSDVLATLWERRTQLEPIRNLRAYLYRAVRNRALNHQRSRQRIEHRYEAITDAESIPGHASRVEAPDVQLEYVEQQRIIWRTVRQMREPMRKVAILRWSHSLSFAEIAHVTGISENAARVYVSRALILLRKTLPDLLR